jgi:hypothetical protein
MEVHDMADDARYSAPTAQERLHEHGPRVLSDVDCIAGVIANPVPEIYTNPAHPELARAYYQDVAAFEAKAASTR